MENLVTTDKIIDWITEQVENKQPIDPHLWLEASMKLNVLLQTEQEKLFELEQVVALAKAMHLEQGKSVGYAKTMIESTDQYKLARKQKAKIDRVIEFIRLSKLYSRISQEIMTSQ